MNYNNIVSSMKSLPMVGIIGSMFTNGTLDKFDDTSTSLTTGVIIMLVIIIIISLMTIVATYKLTGSALQTVLCLLFGCIYLTFAYIYYGFSDYTFQKMKNRN